MVPVKLQVMSYVPTATEDEAVIVNELDVLFGSTIVNDDVEKLMPDVEDNETYNGPDCIVLFKTKVILPDADPPGVILTAPLSVMADIGGDEIIVREGP